MQGNCSQPAPSVPVVANLTLRDVDVADNMCQILADSGGLLSYDNIKQPRPGPDAARRVGTRSPLHQLDHLAGTAIIGCHILGTFK